MAGGITTNKLIAMILIIFVLVVAIIGIFKFNVIGTLKDFFPDFKKVDRIVKYEGTSTLENPYYVSFYVYSDEMDIQYFYNPNSKAFILGKPDAQGVVTYQAFGKWWGPNPTPLYYRYNSNKKKWEWSPPPVSGRRYWMETDKEKVRHGVPKWGGASPVAENLEIIGNLNIHDPKPNVAAESWRWFSHVGWISVDNKIIKNIALKRKYYSIWTGRGKEKRIADTNNEFLNELKGKSAEDGLKTIVEVAVNPEKYGFPAELGNDFKQVQFWVYFYDGSGKRVPSVDFCNPCYAVDDEKKLLDLDEFINTINRISRRYVR